MPSPQFRNVGPTVLRHGRLGVAAQAPIWLDAAPCHDDRTVVTGLGIPRFRNVGPTVLRNGRRGDGVQWPIWFDRAPARDDQTFFVPNMPALCDVGPMVQRQGRKRTATQSPIWLDKAPPQDDQSHILSRMVPNPFVGPMALRRGQNPIRNAAARFYDVAPVRVLGTGAITPVSYITVSDSSPVTAIDPDMNSYLFGVPFVKLTVEFLDDDGYLTDPSTIQLRLYRTGVLQTTLHYPADTYLGQAITRASVGCFTFKVMSPALAAWDYAWDTTAPVRLAESSFKVIARKH